MGRAPWRLPGYRVERLIGAGGYGEVWQAEVRATGASVALKRIPLSDPTQRKAALSEAAMLSALAHPHLVRLHRLVQVDGALVLVLDLASGGTLARLLASRGRLTPGETITALAPIAAALAHAHAAGVVHGDVTAGNVLFTAAGLPLLADLGVARLLGQLGPVRTTPEYAEPGVAAGYLPVPASDVFMLGAVALHTLTGALPWPDAAPAEPAAAAGWRADVERRLSEVGVAHEMAAVVLRSLAFEPERRGTAADFALDLRHSGHPVAVELTAGRTRMEPSLARLAAIAAQRPFPEPGSRPAAAVAPLPASALPFTHGARVPSPLVARRPRHSDGARSLAMSTPVAALIITLGMVVAALAWWIGVSGDPPRGPSAVAPMRPSAANPDRSMSPPADAARAPGHGARAGPLPDTGAQRRVQSPAPAGARGHAAQARSSRGNHARAPVRRATPRQPPWPFDATLAGRVLAHLDQQRAAAFSARDPELLRRVYSSPALLARDSALLAHAVPLGCGLRGVHTVFSDVRIRGRTAELVRVLVRAALTPSTLVCGATRTATAPGAGPSALRIELTHAVGGYRIATLRVLG